MNIHKRYEEKITADPKTWLLCLYSTEGASASLYRTLLFRREKILTPPTLPCPHSPILSTTSHGQRQLSLPPQIEVQANDCLYRYPASRRRARPSVDDTSSGGVSSPRRFCCTSERTFSGA